ncbi:hypothetical protein [Thalassotalea piscium]|uniref:Uncharacterized protein n=1 Tax=Thalassotalea piscium TaxID=1230533 RepID=A0A7X0NJT8_9GAMM|nr:hypothetical protein [Thalassotalea piscium]MBB6544758.1 hypothetical protein [Thalassotalea piscium]
MPQIYLTQAEMDALDFFQGVTMAAYEAVDNEELQKEYSKYSELYYSVYSKFKCSKKKAADKALVKRVLKEIKTKKQSLE